MSGDAVQIYQTLLDKLTLALVRHDMESWLESIAVPHQMSTADGKLVHETKRDVEVGFIDFVGAMARIGVTRIERKCEAAGHTGPGEITGYHSTALFRDNSEALPRFMVGWTLKKCADGQWRVTKADSAVSSDDWADIPYKHLTQFERVDTTSEQRLRKIIQQHFDQIDLTFLHGDFEQWRPGYLLPLVVESDHGCSLLDTEAKLRADFDQYRLKFVEHGVTDITRVIRTAELVGDTLLMATYRAYVLNGGDYVIPPWNGGVTMRREKGRWRITKIMNALGHKNWDRVLVQSTKTKDAGSVRKDTVVYLKTPSFGRDTND
jgi:hypothetical protein